MKQNGKKGLSLPMEIIIGVVVLVVIALAVIMFTSGTITKTGNQTNTQSSQTSCGICKQNFCLGKTGAQTMTTECPICGSDKAAQCS